MSDIDWTPRCPRAGVGCKNGRQCVPALPPPRGCVERQRGAVSIMFALGVLFLFGFIGLGLDLAMLYNRKAELQGMADSAALAAASELKGTSGGITNALSKARSTAESFTYQYSKAHVMWSDAALQFSTSGAKDSWVDASTASAAPDGLLFAKVDTSVLAPAMNTVNTVLMGVFDPQSSTKKISGSAIAGRSSLRVTPLGICALSATPANQRINPGSSGAADVSELEEYGFRRGVGYDLMKLNPNDALVSENFVINPIDAIGTNGFNSNELPEVVSALVCNGIMPMPSLMKTSSGARVTISVGHPFPLFRLYNQLNSRFDQYDSTSPNMACNSNDAPPDINIKAYFKDAIPWMTNVSSRTQNADTYSEPPTLLPLSLGKLWTVASPAPPPSPPPPPPALPPPPITAAQYGPLWSYSRAVAFASSEPTSGYMGLNTATWPTLYTTRCAPQPCPPPPPLTYPSGPEPTDMPYMASSGNTFQAPSHPGLRDRRVLNIPLLSCPVGADSNTSATVLAIGRFFMTVPATPSSISAEFAGLVSEQSLGGRVELYP